MKLAPIFYICASFILSITLSAFISIEWSLVGLLVFLVMLWLNEKKKPHILYGSVLMVFFVGLSRGTIFNNNLIRIESDYLRQYGIDRIISGTVSKMPEKSGKGVNVLLGNITGHAGEKLNGYVLIKTNRYPAYEYGDGIRVTGTLTEASNFSDFDYKEYLRQQKIFAIMQYPDIERLDNEDYVPIMRWLFRLQNNISERTIQSLPEPHAALLNGILLGVKNGFDDDFSDLLKRAGIMHLVVVSGTNITILLLIIMKLSSKLGRKLTVLLSIVIIIFYTLMVGSNPPAMRALLMGSIALIASLIGRKSAVINALALSIAGMLWFNPLLIKSISFQLSVLATLGMIVYSGYISSMISGLPIFIRENISVTISAQILILPILSASFGYLSLVSLIANTLIVPLIIPLTLLGIITVIGIFTVPLLSGVLTLPLIIMLGYVTKVVKILGSLPFSSINISSYPVWLYAMYGLVVLYLFTLKIHRGIIDEKI